MNKLFKGLIPLAALCLLLSCTKEELPEMFKSQLMQYLKDASKLSTSVTDGITLVDLNEQLQELKGSHELLSSLWPENFSLSSREKLEKSQEAYKLAYKLFRGKTLNYDEPTEPSTNGFQDFENSILADALIFQKYTNSIVSEYNGKKYVPFDGNIELLLTLGSSFFEAARTELIEELK